MRIRTIKPEFFKNELLAELHALTRLLFVGLWSLADKEGRLEDRPKRIKAELLPYDAHDVDRALSELDKGRFILRYTVDGGAFIQIPTFKKHQRITGSEAESVSQIPAPPSAPSKATQPGTDRQAATGEGQDETARNQARNTEEAPRKHFGNTLETPRTTGREGKGKEGNEEGKGKEGNEEGKGKEGASRFAPPTREELNAQAAKIGLPPVEVDKFVAYYASKGWKVGTVPMKSWPHAMTGWKIRWEEKRNGHTNGKPSPADDRNRFIAGADSPGREAARQAVIARVEAENRLGPGESPALPPDGLGI